MQRYQIFYSRCSVKSKVCNIIIDNERSKNILSRILVDHLKLEGVGQDVDEPRGEYHAGGEGLDDKEDVPIGAEGWDPLAEDGDADTDETPDEDGENGGDLELQRFGLVPVLVGGGAGDKREED